MAGYFFFAEAWQVLPGRLIRADSTVFDIGRACGKTARNLLYHLYIKNIFVWMHMRRASTSAWSA
jgi:hypothetical protein